MVLKEWKEKLYRDCLEDIEIARKEITDVKLFPEGNIICDLYALPSHNFQTYYAMIYEHSGHLEMVYARTEFYTCVSPYNEPIRMYSFSDNKEAGQYPGLDGRIITGIRHIPKEAELLIADITETLPDEKHIFREDTGCIDGVIQAIRVFKGNTIMKEAVYHDAEWIPLKDHREHLTEGLRNLYLTMGDLMGS